MDRSRFVVLEHTQPAKKIPLSRRHYLRGKDQAANLDDVHDQDVHYDLMLECDGGLATFAIAQRLSTANCVMPAIKLPLHRDVYLQYEGAVSNNRGTVRRVMAGTFEIIEIVPQASLKDSFEKLTIELLPSDQNEVLCLVLEQVERERFQLRCSD